MKKLLIYLRPYTGKIALATLFMAISVCCDLILPTIMSNILDKGVYQAAEENTFPYILRSCGVMLAVALVSLASIIVGYWFAASVTAGFTRDLRSAIFRKVNAMTFEEIGAFGTGALVTRSTHDVSNLSWVASMLCGNIVTIPVMFLGGVVLCLTKDVSLSLIMLLSVPLIFAVVAIIGKKIKPLWMGADEYCEKQSDILRERIRGIRVIRAFNREPQEHERVAEATQVMTKNIIRGNVSMEILTPVTSLALNVAVLLIVYFGGIRMEFGTGLTAGDVFAMIQYVSLVMNGVISASFAIVMLPHAKVAAGRISQITELKSKTDPRQKETPDFTGDIVLEDVSFQYEGADKPAVSHVSLHIQAGQRVSVIGGTGSGKSTLVALLLAFRSPTGGRILFDGRDAAAVSPEAIRRNISCVLQKSMIYSGTIRENIRMGKMDATQEELSQVVALAQLSGFVAQQKEGLDYRLTSSGANLSGGQKQRLAIARAVIKDAPIYIFDDSFSALDFLTEARLRAGLNERCRNATQIVITQRVTSAINSDCIFVMDQGLLVDAGKHEELLERCQIYREIYASQTGGVR